MSVRVLKCGERDKREGEGVFENTQCVCVCVWSKHGKIMSQKNLILVVFSIFFYFMRLFLKWETPPQSRLIMILCVSVCVCVPVYCEVSWIQTHITHVHWNSQGWLGGWLSKERIRASSQFDLWPLVSKPCEARPRSNPSSKWGRQICCNYPTRQIVRWLLACENQAAN